MRFPICIFLMMMLSTALSQYNYEPSAQFPYGLPHPESPEELLDFAPLIGECQCESITRNQDNSWADPVAMTWTFKYIMNGKAIQDQTLKADGNHSGSIRQFDPEAGKWKVHYYSSRNPVSNLASWEGAKLENGNIVLYREQKAPNGMEGFYRLTFSNITDEGYDWIGEWVSTDQSIVFPTWKISCKKTADPDNTKAITDIQQSASSFSQAYMEGDLDQMMELYTEDAVIFPPGATIISGKEAIRNRWKLPEGIRILKHQSDSQHLTIIGNTAYDYGYYSGKTLLKNGKESNWKGKYVIVWKPERGKWRMYLDIWNPVKD
ncbi:YybH family protein [Robiginitalea sp. IMCC43444]|uniref:YybH family protein n=1 Tax=Robiginitalea sp. IMCC43444 TaxID=3459121 RepID=UPI0040438CC8